MSLSIPPSVYRGCWPAHLCMSCRPMSNYARQAVDLPLLYLLMLNYAYQGRCHAPHRSTHVHVKFCLVVCWPVPPIMPDMPAHVELHVPRLLAFLACACRTCACPYQFVLARDAVAPQPSCMLPLKLIAVVTCKIQWNLSITDTLGTEKQFVIKRFPLFRGCFIYMAIHSDPQEQFVIERFPLLGEFVIRGSTV